MHADQSVIGAIGRLSVATRGTGGPGEVIVPLRGGTESFLAWSEQPLARGTSVMVFDTRGQRTVDVMEWTETSGDLDEAPAT